MIVTHEHLTGCYCWPLQKQISVFTGQPSRRTFDCFNGFQMLFMINCFAELAENFTVADVEKTESLIHGQFYLQSNSEISVFNWLKAIGTNQEHNDTINKGNDIKKRGLQFQLWKTGSRALPYQPTQNLKEAVR